MYASAAEALSKLLSGEEEGEGLVCEITSMPRSMRLIGNGIKYFSVQVTCSNGVQYGIPAYGDEAEELYSLATETEQRRKKVPVSPLVLG